MPTAQCRSPLLSKVRLILMLRNGFFSYTQSTQLVQSVTSEITIDFEPAPIFPVNTKLQLRCRLPRSRLIYWSSRGETKRGNNPLVVRMTTNEISKRFICHGKDVDGLWHRQVVRIQRYSSDRLIAVMNNESSTTRATSPSTKGSPMILHQSDPISFCDWSSKRTESAHQTDQFALWYQIRFHCSNAVLCGRYESRRASNSVSLTREYRSFIEPIELVVPVGCLAKQCARDRRWPSTHLSVRSIESWNLHMYCRDEKSTSLTIDRFSTWSTNRTCRTRVVVLSNLLVSSGLSLRWTIAGRMYLVRYVFASMDCSKRMSS